MGEVNTLVLMASPELPPAMSYVIALLPSPVCLSDLQGSLVSSYAQAGAGRGPCHFWAVLSADARTSWAAELFRDGPAVAGQVSIFILFYSFS